MLAFNEKKRIPLIPTEKNPETHLELSVGYQAGGSNWYSGNQEKRGYFLYCCPVQRKTFTDGNGEELVTWSQQLGKGKKQLLAEVTRRGKKAEANALKLAENTEVTLIQSVCAVYGLRLAEVVAHE